MKKRTVLFLITACLTALFMTVSASAASIVDSGECGENLTWALDSEGTLTIEGSGEMDDWDGETEFPPWDSYYADIRTVSLPEGLTSIGSNAFYWLDALTTINFPNGLEHIGESAFYSCTALEIPPFPDTLTSIGTQAFYGCEGLRSVTIPDSVTSIGRGAFMWCNNLTSVTIPDSVTAIPISAFSFCTSLSDITIPEGVTSIGASAFYGTSLADITIPGSVTSIDKSAFFNCSALTDVYFYGTEAQWQAIVPDASTVFSNSSDITFHYNVFSITQQPKNVTVKAGGKATFSVTAIGSNLTYQWQFSTDGGKTWKNNTCKTATFTLDNVSANNIDRNGYQYRCKVTNGANTVISDAATLTVTVGAKPAITAQPQPVSVSADGTAKFTVSATGGSLKYQWQYKAPGKGWVNNSCKTATFTINGPQAWRDGYQYRCKVTNSVGTTTSSPAILTITAAAEELKITKQPKSITVNAADKATFSVTAKGTDLTYQWQFKAPGAKWVNNTCTKATLTINPAKLWRDGYRYRCVITDVDGNVLISSVAALTVN